MSRIRKTYEATVCGVTIRGASSIAEAKREAIERLEEHSRASRFPEVLFPGRLIIIIAHVLGIGWQWSAEDPAEHRDPYWHSAASQGDARRRALRHAADLQHSIEDGIEAPAYVTDEKDRAAYREYWQWQYDYLRIRAAGYSDYEAHSMAGTGNPGRKRLPSDPPGRVPFDPALMPEYLAGKEAFRAVA